MAYRLIVSDMDDTLLNGEGVLSPASLDAVKAVHRTGAHFALASGRMPCAMLSYARQLDIRVPMIAYNGAQLTDPRSGEVLFELPVEAPLALELMRWCEQRQIHIQAYRGDAFFTPSDNEWARRYYDSLRGLARMQVTGRPLSECAAWPQPKLLAIMNPAHTPAVLAEVKQAFGNRLICATSRPQYIEFTSPLAGKERALSELCRRLTISKEEVVAFGDGQNDVGMLRFARLGYAMANARAEVRAQACLTAPSNREDGVARTIMNLISDRRIGSE